MRALRIDTVRGRLTAFYITALAAALIKDDRHRLALRRVIIPLHNAGYIVVAASSLEPTDEELESLREILAYVVPIALRSFPLPAELTHARVYLSFTCEFVSC